MNRSIEIGQPVIFVSMNYRYVFSLTYLLVRHETRLICVHRLSGMLMISFFLMITRSCSHSFRLLGWKGDPSSWSGESRTARP